MISIKDFAFRTSLLAAIVFQWGAIANAQSIGENMVTYLESSLNQRVGGGSSSHLATEALRIAGAEFVSADLGDDYPAWGDKTWGTLVTQLASANGTVTDSSPTQACQPGDVIQFGSAEIGTTIYPWRFTAVVARVNSAGRPNSVYQQNLDGNRTVQKASIDTTQLTSGWMRIYRPITRIDRFNEWKFTVVNNSSSSQTYELMDGVFVDSTVTLNAANMSGSFRVHVVTTIGTVPNYYLDSNQLSYFVQTAKGNEIYDSSDGPGIRQLGQ